MSILSAPKTQAKMQPALTGIQIQTSSYGKCVPLLYGTCRSAGNLIWYGDFSSYTTSSSGGGGKGSAPKSKTTLYKAGFAFAICEGPIIGIPNLISGKTKTPVSARPNVVFNGTYPQAPWTHLTSAHPSDAYGYNGIAYLANAAQGLGSDASLPNYNFEVEGAFSTSVAGSQDADASLVVADFLTNPHYGAGFPVARIGDLTAYQDYVLSAGLLVSFVLSDQAQASSTLADLATATNSEFVWSSGVLSLVPYGDAALAGNGKTYAPPSAPIFDLTDDDFLPSGNSGNTDDPVNLVRLRPSDAINSLQLEFLDRSNDYNTAIAQADDQAAIDLYGLRQQSASSTHMFCDAGAANNSVRLQLQRQLIRNTYQFTTDERYILLDPMDIVTITDAALGLNRQWVRITEIDLNDDGTLTFTAEEYLAGTASAASYSFQTGNGYVPDYNIAPGNANVPLILDAPVQIAPTGLEVWIAASGGSAWGGCEVWISTDDETYRLAGRIEGSARQGVLTAALGMGADPDTVHTLSVDLTESAGTLLSGTQDDADQGATLCAVGTELVAYETATLTAAGRYDLTYLRRGMYGSPVESHLSGEAFARLDTAVLHYSYDKSQIGQTIYVKLLSFNLFGNAEQSLADVSPYTHVLAGPPAPSVVTNFIVAQNGNAVNFTWTQIADFALKGYDIGYADQGETDWSEFNLLTEASKGTEMTNASVPSGTWTFGIRARDIADQLGPLSTFDLVIENENDTTTVQVQEPGFAGQMSGFIRHWTGVLVPDSTTLANHTSDFTVFDTFVPDPVASCSYTTPTFDIGFENSLRVHWTYDLTPGPGQSAGAAATAGLDAWTSGSDPDTYQPWTVGTVPVRYLNMQITYEPVAGEVAYLDDFTYTVDRSPLIEQDQNETIAAGGTTVTFDQPFHAVPYVTPTVVSASPLYATATSITTMGCTIHVWDHTGADVGGTVNITSKGY